MTLRARALLIVFVLLYFCPALDSLSYTAREQFLYARLSIDKVQDSLGQTEAYRDGRALPRQTLPRCATDSRCRARAQVQARARTEEREIAREQQQERASSNDSCTCHYH